MATASGVRSVDEGAGALGDGRDGAGTFGHGGGHPSPTALARVRRAGQSGSVRRSVPRLGLEPERVAVLELLLARPRARRRTSPPPGRAPGRSAGSMTTPSASTSRRRTPATQPSARIGRPIGHGPLELDGHPGGDAPVVVVDQRPGHDLVEERAHDPAVRDPVPALEPAIERELRPAAVAAGVELELEAVRVQRPAGEAVVRREHDPARPRCGRPGASPAAQMSRLRTLRASVLMKSLRGSTRSPMSIVKIASASPASSTSTLQQRPRLRVHRRLPELVGVHLAEALEALDAQVLGRELLDDPLAVLLGLGVAW